MWLPGQTESGGAFHRGLFSLSLSLSTEISLDLSQPVPEPLTPVSFIPILVSFCPQPGEISLLISEGDWDYQESATSFRAF